MEKLSCTKINIDKLGKTQIILDLKKIMQDTSLGTLEYRIVDPGLLLFFSQKVNRVADFKQSL